jgi:small-conductance mechanosensitive channel
MKFRRSTPVIVIVVALVIVGWGVYRTGSQPSVPASSSVRRAPSDRTIVVDQSSLLTAEQLLRLPTSPDERPFAQDALHVADNEMDLAFAQAVRRAGILPPATSDTAKQAAARLGQALRALATDQAQVTTLSAAVAKANAVNAESLNDRLNLTKAQVELDQDEVDDARQDLRRSGGDPSGRMADMIAEHDAASKSSDSVRVVVTQPADVSGLVHHLQALQVARQKEAQLGKAAVSPLQSPTASLTHDSAAALLATIHGRSVDKKIRATLNERVDNQRRLSDIYSGWIAVLGAAKRSALNVALYDIEVILIIVLVAMLLTRWIEHMLARTPMRAHTLYIVARVAPQIVGVLLIVFVLFGAPSNLGTIIGLVGAGLTVALKDFIIGFMGWFVLVGKNGIRIGDLVEINGVTGEVVQLGMFRTALLETGDWSESGHLTGRRVTFNNSYAIEQHYFNFSTSGRWLWDSVRIVVPAGRDPYPIAEAMRKQIEESTAASALEAEAEWSRARRSPNVAAPATGVSVSLRPIEVGIEITLRYITRVTERDELRGKLYRTAVDMLGEVPMIATGATPT